MLLGPRQGVASCASACRSDTSGIAISASASILICASRIAPGQPLVERAHWLTVEWLPKDAPELNDIEVLWRDLKRHHLAHQTFNGPDDLDRAIDEAVIKLNTERNRHPLANQRIAA